MGRVAQKHSSPISDDEHHARKRVCKACDRCRLKKSKCDGASPCTRCQLDNAICVFTERKRAHDKQYPKGYVEMLESQQQQLVTGLQLLYKMAVNGSWIGPLLDTSVHGEPLTHDILERLGLLKNDSEHGGFEEDFETMQKRLLHGAEVAQRHSEAEGLSPRFISASPHVSSRNSSYYERDTPSLPPTPVDMQPFPQLTSDTNTTPATLATFNAMRFNRQSWSGPVSTTIQSMPSYTNDDMEYLFKPSFFSPIQPQMTIFDDPAMISTISPAMMAPVPDMDVDIYLT